MMLTTSLDPFQLSGSPSIRVENPNYSTVTDALATLQRRTKPGQTPADISSDLQEIYSEEQLKFELGAHIESGIHDFTAKVDFSKKSTSNKVMYKYYQKYYDISITPPTTPYQLFKDERELTGDELYVSSTSYGRMLIYLFESDASMTDLKAAVGYSMGKSVNVTSVAKYSEILRNTKIQVFIRGGASGDGIHVINNGIEGIKRYLSAGANFGPSSPGKLLSYSLAFALDNSPAFVNLSTSYEKRSCVKATGRFRASNIKLTCVRLDDPGNSEEYYGWLYMNARVYDKTGRMISSGIEQTKKNPIWDKKRRNYISVKQGDQESVTISDDITFTFQSFHEIDLERSYFEFNAALYEADDIGPDDTYIGPGPVKVHFNEANRSVGLDFHDWNSHARFSFDLQPL
jgi:thiol-activated cytolysin